MAIAGANQHRKMIAAAEDMEMNTSPIDGIGITELQDILEALSEEQRVLFHRIFRVSGARGRIDPPPEMLPWIEKQFGSLPDVLEQKVLKITNVVTFEGALYNRLRATRPIQTDEKLAIQASIIDNSRNDPLHDPLRLTPRDPFGRVEGKYCVTAGNIAKYDGLHGMVVFDTPNPLSFGREHIHDYLDTGWSWAQKAHQYQSEAKYYLFIWNCLRRAGASLLHGHAQMTLGCDCHYAKIEGLRRAALAYQDEHGSNYFDDLFRIHFMLGLGEEKEGARLISYITPVKEREVMVLASAHDDVFKDAVFSALSCLRDYMHGSAFNLMVTTPPLVETEENWKGFPVIARAVDRGQPKSTSCDIGTMELYASNVISSDPFEVARALKECIFEEGENFA
ncbi:MAG: hypothetical protein QF579_06675 [Dehalococcoidia bacterium]|jgi:hypothetical protein|nr:hypothetical protein [Dehalococcoidia bacterium]